MESSNNPIELLAKKWSLQLDEMQKARGEAFSRRRQLKEICEGEKLSEDTSVVVFGSLARDEYTAGSDLDWTFLVDGEANSDHSKVAQRITSSIKEEFKVPNPTGAFGGMTFSHQLIHNIGGPEDTNTNTTHRVLLLLESRSIHGDGDAVYGRVVRGIINRYVEQDVSSLNRQETGYKVPRFLLNDVVRFWRTMAVDFASKQWVRGGEGWGLRNAKLRLSRKLIYVSGLLTCFSCSLDSDLNAKIDSQGDTKLRLVTHLRKTVKNAPLEMLAKLLLLYDANGESSRLIFTSYDRFLGLLNGDENRAQLQGLRAEDSAHHPLFARIRDISDAFQNGLDKFFFENQSITPLTRKYGVF